MAKNERMIAITIPEELRDRIKKAQLRQPDPARHLSLRRFVAWLLDIAIKKEASR